MVHSENLKGAFYRVERACYSALSPPADKMPPSTIANCPSALADAKRRGDVLELQRILSEMTTLMHMQFGYPNRTFHRLEHASFAWRTIKPNMERVGGAVSKTSSIETPDS
jgi:hypothetical protein